MRDADENISDTDEADPYAEYLWPRPAHPLLRRLNPRRIRQRRQARHAVRYEHYGPPIAEGGPTDLRSITFWHRDQSGWPIGKVSYLLCHDCRRGFIGNLDVQKNHWGHGIATDALAYIRRQVPGYIWRTSWHQLQAKSFWLLIAERTGKDYTDIEADRACEHMAPFWPSGRAR